ncbi:MAG: DUF6777 domain-containing protein [Actinomycetota bacterium]
MPPASPAAETGAPDGAAAVGEVCDLPLLLERLAANPPVAQAWVLGHGLDPAALAGIGAGLTPVILLQDTLVTDHGYRSAKILARRAVLQRGTAVLVDARGVPVAACRGARCRRRVLWPTTPRSAARPGWGSTRGR